MATVTAKAHKVFGRGFSNERQTVKLTYNFGDDAGAFADAVKIGTTDGKILVLDSRVHVETACTSGGSATVIVGVAGGDTDAFMDLTSGAVASLVDDYVATETTGQGIVLASGAAIHLDIGTADLTAGKINVILGYMNID
jgi:hypothetical protein